MDNARASREGTARVAQLIEMGRDREAAELAVAHRHPFHDAQSHSEGEPMEALDQLDRIGPLLAGVVGGIREDQLDNPTPCAAFTVRGILEHMISGATVFGAAFRGEVAGPPDLSEVLGGFGSALAGLAESIHRPGALDRTIEAPFGAVSGDTFARYVVLDGLVHGWDLATATGQPYDPPADLVEAAETFGRTVVDPMRDGDTFAAAKSAPPGATPIEQLAAFTGRYVPSS
jgi:uncharacterized protein (TIGR03086 family)